MSCWRRRYPVSQAPLATTPNSDWKPSTWCHGPTMSLRVWTEAFRKTLRWLSLWCRGILNCKLRWRKQHCLLPIHKSETSFKLIFFLQAARVGVLWPGRHGTSYWWIPGTFHRLLGFFDFVCQFVGSIYIAMKSHFEYVLGVWWISTRCKSIQCRR